MTQMQAGQGGDQQQAPQGMAPPPPGGPQALKSDEKTMGLLCHLLAIFTGFLGPLIIWLIKKDESQFVDVCGKEALNFQITVFIAMVGAGVLTFVIIGVFLVPLIWAADLIFCIVATVKANAGEAYRYPISIRFVK